MKDYLVLIRGGDSRMDELNEAQRKEHMNKWGVFMQGLAKSGSMTGGMPLTPDGRLLTKEGATSDMVVTNQGDAIGGYLILKARDYDHAVELCGSCPVFEYDGNLEIREAMHME